MKTIVVPTDFSPVSLNAVNYAADMACIIGTSLSLVHVCPLPLVFSEIPIPQYGIEGLIADAQKKLEELEGEIMYRTRDRIKVTSIVTQGDLIEGINNYCASVSPYAVVMGAENADFFEKIISGAKTLAAVKHLSWPVIIIPLEAKFECIRKIALACDFRKVVETIPAKEIKSLVDEFHAELHILHVNEVDVNSLDQQTIEESGWVQQILGKLKPKYHFIKSTNIEKSINEFAENNNIDFSIVLPKKHNLFSKVFYHSHSKRLVLHTHVPVMAVHE
ncbi:MAG: universal stress protein [Chitinophagaceae bacterium]|nr:universal stress protein [Chitinophagaceae bacterium]